MTVLSVMAGSREGASVRHPLDLIQCMSKAWAAPKGKKVCARMQAARHSKSSTSSLAGQDFKEGLRDAMSFIFCSQGAAAISHQMTKADIDEKEEEWTQQRRVDAARLQCVGGVQLPPFEYAHIALLLPAAVAAHGGLLVSGGAACACMPLSAPFRVPQVSPETWMANKRARAFHRCCVIGVYTQGGLALFKFAGGDLVGGLYMAIQAAMGAYAITPDGTSFMPSYLMISGFNGVLGAVQLLQSFQGVPLHNIPFLAALPPVVSILSCYWGWQFCRELRAIGTGMNCDGPQDSLWVQFMGTDAWPISALSPTLDSGERERNGGESVIGAPAATRFSAFGGNGHRLGAGAE